MKYLPRRFSDAASALCLASTAHLRYWIGCRCPGYIQNELLYCQKRSDTHSVGFFRPNNIPFVRNGLSFIEVQLLCAWSAADKLVVFTPSRHQCITKLFFIFAGASFVIFDRIAWELVYIFGTSKLLNW